MRPKPAEPAAAWRLDGGPLLFSGFPPVCTGALVLVNESDQRLKVRSIPVADLEGSSHRGLGRAELRVSARLQPSSSVRASARLWIDPHTPPGKYSASVSCGDRREPLVVHVWKKPALLVEPNPLRLHGAAGEEVEATLVVSNEGNIVETLRETAAVFLEERTWVQRSLVDAIPAAEDSGGAQAYVDRFVGRLQETLVAPARIRFASEKMTWDCGDRREVRITVRFPDGMLRGREYIGSLRFMSGRLAFRIDCNGDASTKKTATRKTRRPT